MRLSDKIEKVECPHCKIKHIKCVRVSNLKKSIKELLDTRKLYGGTNEWVISVKDIEAIFGKEITKEGDNKA